MIRVPKPEFCDSVAGFGHGPGLTPGKGAASAQKITYFTGALREKSPRSRAPAPEVCESSVESAFSGGGGGGLDGGPISTVKPETFRVLDLSFAIGLKIPAEKGHDPR